MALHCFNILKITGPSSDVRKFHFFCQNTRKIRRNNNDKRLTWDFNIFGDGPFMFEWFLPVPENKQGNNISKWLMENWGTDSNPHEFDFNEFKKTAKGNKLMLELDFWTTWNIPRIFFRNMSTQYPALTFELVSTEDDNDDIHYISIKNGKINETSK